VSLKKRKGCERRVLEAEMASNKMLGSLVRMVNFALWWCRFTGSVRCHGNPFFGCLLCL